MYLFSRLVHLEQIKPGEWDFSLANPGSCVYHGQSHQMAVDWEWEGVILWIKTEELLPNTGGLMLGRQQQRSRASSAPPVCNPNHCMPYYMWSFIHVWESLKERGPQPSSCLPEWIQFCPVHNKRRPVESSPDQMQPEGEDRQSKPLPLWFSPPRLWTQPERGAVSTTLHTSLSSQSCWLARWRP